MQRSYKAGFPKLRQRGTGGPFASAQKGWKRKNPSSEQIRQSAAPQGPGRSPSDDRGLGAEDLQPMESAPRPPVASAIRAAAAGHGRAWGFFPPYKVSLYGEI